MGHLEILGYLAAILIVIYIVWQNSIREKAEDKERGGYLKYSYTYPRLAMTVDTIIVSSKDNRKMILLIQRKFDPFQNFWALPGGFVGMEETLQQAAVRELYEETGLRNIRLNQFFTFDAIGRDPRHRTVTTVFCGNIDIPMPVTGGDDANHADWFPIDSLPEMAFDHAQIIRKFEKEML